MSPMHRRSNRNNGEPIAASTLALTLALASAGACKGKTVDEDPSGESKGAAQTEAGVEVVVDPADAASPIARDEEPDDPRALALTIARAEAPASTGGAGLKSLGFRLDKLTHLFALAATAKLPDWGAVGTGEPKLARDDDLDTAWTCKFGEAKPCVLGLALPEPAKVEVVRLFTAAGPRYRDYNANPRVTKVRVHTDAGYVDANLADGANHTYVRFDAPIETQSIAIEVLAIHSSKTEGLVHLAEVEIYGTDGVPRQALELDPDLAWASWETTAWGGSGGNHTIRQVFINFARLDQGVDPEQGPARRRLMRATAVFGKASDDYLLFERLHGTDCTEQQGNYVLFDRRNRMYYALGELGGAGAEVYRHAGGRGFAVGWVGAEQFTVKGIVEEAGELKWRRAPKQAPADGKALLREWGFETEPLARGLPLEGAVVGCHRAALGELEPLVAAARFTAAGQEDPSQWMVCSVGDDTLYASAPCGAPARAYQLRDGKLVGKHEGKKSDARGLRLRRYGDRLFVELSSAGGDTGTLLWAEPGKLFVLAAAGALFVRPPSSCSDCDGDWSNPAGPVADEDEYDEDPEFVDDGEDYADEGNDESLVPDDDDDDDDGDDDDDDDEVVERPPPRPIPPR